MVVKLRLKRADLELEYEGDSSLLSEKLADWVEVLKADLEEASRATIGPTRRSASSNGGAVETTASAIASAIGAKSGPDLFRCALAYYQLAEGRERATRAEILAQMKSVSHVYRATMLSNLSRIIHSLLSDRLINEPQRGSYCLTVDALASISHALPR